MREYRVSFADGRTEVQFACSSLDAIHQAEEGAKAGPFPGVRVTAAVEVVPREYHGRDIPRRSSEAD